MPVWHERTRALREAGTLQVVGIVEEQHPDRALLYRTWQGLDWPILWDPFGRTGSSVVPVPMLVDEHGIVRKVGARPDDLAAFLAADYPAPDSVPAIPLATPPRLVELDAPDLDPARRAHLEALSALLWPGTEGLPDPDAAVERLVADADAARDDSWYQFQAGVALRMRTDSPRRREDDFQRALDRWARALDLEPNRYVWRRRIQQYGPRLDKPYPFYTWVDEARTALRARGIEPPPLLAELTPAELMAPRRAVAEAGAAVEPDPGGRITRDDGLVALEHAVAFQTEGARADEPCTAMVHLALRPVAAREAHWNNEVDPLRVWLDPAGLPAGARVDARLLEAPLPPEATSDEVRRFAVELSLPAGVAAAELSGYALYHVCEGVEGTCVYRRLDFTVPVARR